MILTFDCLKRILPELNETVISPERILAKLAALNVKVFDAAIEENGYYITTAKRDYIFLKNGMAHLIYHETLAHEFSHFGCHYPADFLRRKHQLEAEMMSLICMMPLTNLSRLNAVRHQFDNENYDLLMRRNKGFEVWSL